MEWDIAKLLTGETEVLKALTSHGDEQLNQKLLQITRTWFKAHKRKMKQCVECSENVVNARKYCNNHLAKAFPCEIKGCGNYYIYKKLCSTHHTQLTKGQSVTTIRSYQKQKVLDYKCLYCKNMAVRLFHSTPICVNHSDINTRMTIYRNKNRNKVNELEYKARKSRYLNPSIKIAQNLRSRIGHIMRKINARKPEKLSAVTHLGCTIKELMSYLERKFKPGMTWGNYGKKGWHLDHIIPLTAFNLIDPEQFKKACHYTNLQPLWAHENISKSNRVNGKRVTFLENHG